MIGAQGESGFVTVRVFFVFCFFASLRKSKPLASVELQRVFYINMYGYHILVDVKLPRGVSASKQLRVYSKVVIVQSTHVAFLRQPRIGKLMYFATKHFERDVLLPATSPSR